MPLPSPRRPLAVGLAVALACAAFASPALAQDLKPKRRDTNPRLRPPEVVLSTRIEPAVAKPGDTVTYTVTANVEEPWHIYAFARAQPDEGPRSTEFDLFDPAGLKSVGDWTPDHAPERAKEPAFPSLDSVAFHEGKVSWSIKLQVPADAKAGMHTVKSQIYFQICKDQSCKPPVNITVPDATVTVGGGSGGTATTRPAAPVGPTSDRGDPRPERRGGHLGTMLRAAATRLVAFPGAVALAPLTVGLIGDEAAPAAGPEAPVAAAPSTATPSAPTAATAAAPGTVQQAIDQGFGSFLVFAALGGLLALLMPCVWPMIPITVNFFVKQGQKGGSTTGLALTYCLAIIGIFTLLGVVMTAFLGATALNQLASNGWVNLALGLVFIAFGLSLLGLFELRLPTFLLNASASKESSGGLVGVIFMALTLTITSFSCTVPVVGGLLVLAAKGSYWYPIIGMVVFSSVLAFPFLLLALMPGRLSTLPRSGDWMNAVKVVGGLIEIGAAFKFLNTAEIGFGASPDSAWFDAQVVLSIWVVLATICGLYLLGFFRTDHDHDDVKVGAGRMVLGAGFLTLALYLAPALFGNPPKGRVYERMVVGMLPADVGELDASRQLLAALPTLGGTAGSSTASLVAGERQEEVKATSSDPEEAMRQEKKVHGVRWGLSYKQALEEAKAQNRPVLIDFTGVNCANCRTMEQGVFPRPEVVALLKQFVTVSLYVDRIPIETLSADDKQSFAEENALFELDLVQQQNQPYYVVVTPDGKVLAQSAFAEAPQFVSFLKAGLEKFQGGPAKVASSDQPAR